jgi:hypothetical protein
MEPLDRIFPMLTGSFFPQYSDPHPGFENPEVHYEERREEIMEFVKSNKYAGTPSTVAMSPHYSYSVADGDKRTPLSLQADGTMSSEDESPVQHPSQFPWLSPPPRKIPVIVPVLETPNGTTKNDLKDSNSNENEKKSDETEKQPSRLNRLRLGILGLLLVSLLIVGIVIATKMIKPPAKENSNFSDDLSLVGIANHGSVEPTVPTLMGATPGTHSQPPNAYGSPRPTVSLQPSKAPRPTVAPSVATIPPTQAPSTRPPTLKTNHPLLGILQGFVPREQLLDPNTPQ